MLSPINENIFGDFYTLLSNILVKIYNSSKQSNDQFMINRFSEEYK